MQTKSRPYFTTMTDRCQYFAYGYCRLSREESRQGESGSISTQRQMIEAYCEQNDIALLDCFVDDGWSGGNFDRPGFQAMMRALETGKANPIPYNFG